MKDRVCRCRVRPEDASNLGGLLRSAEAKCCGEQYSREQNSGSRCLTQHPASLFVAPHLFHVCAVPLAVAVCAAFSPFARVVSNSSSIVCCDDAEPTRKIQSGPTRADESRATIATFRISLFLAIVIGISSTSGLTIGSLSLRALQPSRASRQPMLSVAASWLL